jgi:hypothetical protein
MQVYKTSTATLPRRPFVIKRMSRKRADYIPSSTRSTKKCRHERMVEGSRVGDTVGTSFVSDTSAISRQLVDIISPKACQLCVVFRDRITGEELPPAYGNGGLLRGPKIVGAPEARQAQAPHQQGPSPVRKKTKFEEFSSYEGTPVTAKHNLIAGDGEEYVRSIIRFPETGPIETVMPDGGCVMEEYIIVRPETDDVLAFATQDNDFSFGSKETTPEKTVTKMPFLYQQVPNTFELRAGHMIGMAVFRKYNINHEDAEAPSSLELTVGMGQSIRLVSTREKSPRSQIMVKPFVTISTHLKDAPVLLSFCLIKTNQMTWITLWLAWQLAFILAGSTSATTWLSNSPIRKTYSE